MALPSLIAVTVALASSEEYLRIVSCLQARLRCMTSEDYPYLAQLTVPDQLRLAAYVAAERGVPAIHLTVILDVAEGLENVGLSVRDYISSSLAPP